VALFDQQQSSRSQIILLRFAELLVPFCELVSVLAFQAIESNIFHLWNIFKSRRMGSRQARPDDRPAAKCSANGELRFVDPAWRLLEAMPPINIKVAP
jgi:hypothetical protein